MTEKDLLQIKDCIGMPAEMADNLLQGCMQTEKPHLSYRRYSRLAAALLAAVILAGTGFTAQAAYGVYQEKNIAVFMEAELTQEEISEIGAQLERLPGVSSCQFISGDEAWERFRTAYLDDELAAGITENPLKDSFNYRLRISLTADTQEIRREIESIAGVRLVQNLEEMGREG